MIVSSPSPPASGFSTMPRGATKFLFRISPRLWLGLSTAVFFWSVFTTTTKCASVEKAKFSSSHRQEELEGSFFDRPREAFSVLRKVRAERQAENAIVRPFPPQDAEGLFASFQLWEEYFPCDTASLLKTSKTDLVLSFSQTLQDHPNIELLVQKFRAEFDTKHGWSRCFDKLIICEAQMSPKEDIYLKGQPRSLEWVLGPNIQFQRTFHAMVRAQYKTMILVEKDTTPRVDNWLNRLLQESEAHQPFAVLGSKYCGNGWNGIRDKMSKSMLDHLNGNAIYNVTHPFLQLMVSEMVAELDTPLKQVPFDVRMAQIVNEGSLGMPPDLPVNNSGAFNWGRSNEGTDQNVDDVVDKAHKFEMWWNSYGKEQNPMRETKAIKNMHVNDFLPRHVADGVLVHGTNEYRPWNPKNQSITLVVSGYGDAVLSNDMKESFASSQHPFSELIVMQDSDGAVKMEQDLTIPAWRTIRKSTVTMDMCDAPVSNKWFMLTNTYHKLAPYTDIMVTPDHKPVLHYLPADECSMNSHCKLILDDAKRFYPSLDKVVLDSDMIYHEETRNAFCQAWKTTNSTGVPTAASFVAYLYSQTWAEYLYSFSDKIRHGSYDAFIRVSTSPPTPTTTSPSLRLSSTPVVNQSIETSHSVEQRSVRLTDAERRKRWNMLMGQEFKPQELPIPCEEFERIKIIRRLGNGLRKTADEGRYNGLDVVVKKLVEMNRTTAELKTAKRYSLKEAGVLFQLRNASNVMRMIGWCNNTMVVSGVVNTTLADLIIQGETTSPQRKLEISLDVARSIQQVHEHRFIHNDIKPSHFLVNKDGKVLLDDFDQVRIPTIGDDIIEFLAFSINPYRPPEELVGKPKDISSDIYAISLILWSVWAESATPYPVWDEEKSKAVGLGKLRPDLAELKDCPEPLQRVLVQAWDHDPLRRPTASQIVQQLEALMEISSRTVTKTK